MATAEIMSLKKITRRTLFQFGATGLVTIGFSKLGLKVPYPLANNPVERPDILGTSFSQVQCRHLKMSEAETRETYLKTLDMGFDIIRIGAYMDELDEKGFDFLDWQIVEAEKRGVELMLNVGIKVQRYPEFHPPLKMRERLRFWEKSHQTIGEDDQTFQEIISSTRSVIQRYKDRKIIKYWQIENEPFDRLSFANNHIVAKHLHDKQAEILKQLIPDAKRAMSGAVGLPDSEDNFRNMLNDKPDVGGFNVYYMVPKPQGGYYTLTNSDFEKLSIKAFTLKQAGITPIIFESQAEPWENGSPVHTEDKDYPSSNPDMAIRLASKLGSIGYNTVMLWGAEYWIYRANRGNTSWIDKIANFINSKKTA